MGTKKPRKLSKAQATKKSFTRTQTADMADGQQSGGQAVKTLREKAVCLALHIGQFTNVHQVDSDKARVNADKGWFSLLHKLVDSDELRAIVSGDDKMRMYVYSMSLPFESGVYMVPVSLVERVEEQLKEYAEERVGLVEKFVAAFPGLCQEARKPSGELYDPSEYPSARYVQSCFYFNWYYIAFTVPGQLSKVSSALFETARAKWDARVEEAMDEARNVLRTVAFSLLDNLRQKLEPAADGKRKVLRATSITKLQEFFELFDFKNLTDDAQLQQFVLQARRMMKGVSVESLRTTDLVRDRVKSEVTEICKSLEVMVQPGRRFRFDEEE